MSHLSSQVEFAPKVMYIGLHMVIIKFHQVFIENDLQLDINAKLDLKSHKKKSEMSSSTQLYVDKWYRT